MPGQECFGTLLPGVPTHESQPGVLCQQTPPSQCKGGLHQAIVDSSCTQTLVQQILVEPGVLLEEGWVENRCVHGDIYKYPITSLRLPLVIHSMGFFPLEQFRDDTLHPAFDQVNN